MKRNLLLLIIFNVFFFMGLYYNRKKQTPTDQMISYYNWISRYDLYDYEESILKDGDVQKLHAIMGESGVEKMPYVIIMYDVYHKDVCEQLSNIYYMNRWQDYIKHNELGFIPFRNFVDDVVSEYEEKGYDYHSYHTAEIEKNIQRHEN